LSSYTVFSERRNYSATNPFTVTRNKLNAYEGDINIAGSRAVDSAKFVVASPVDVKIGDTVSCISDDVDTSELIGAWNFYHNLRDESGYNLDATVTSGTLVYARETLEASRFRGHPYVDFSTGSPVITITPTTTENNTTIINFDSDSAIVLWCKVPSLSTGESQIIFDRSDSSNGLRIGVQNSGGDYYAYLQVKGSSGSWQTSTLNANVGTAGGDDIMISVEKYSFGSTQYRISVNAGYWNYAIYSGSIEEPLVGGQPTNQPPIRLGLSSAGSERFEGRLYSLRMYTKVLTSTDYSAIFERKQPFSTMKFAGKVTKVDDGNSATKIEAVGFSSELLLKTEMTKSFASHLTDDGAYKYDSSDATTKKATLLENIIANIISAVNSDVLDGDDIKYEFVYDNVDDEDDINSGSQAWKDTTNQFHMRNINKLDVSGKLHSLTQILAILGGQEYNSSGNLQHNHGADSFFMLPRKVLVYESSDIDSNTYFSIGRYNILDGGYSSNTIYNDVSIFGKGDVKYHNFDIDLSDYYLQPDTIGGTSNTFDITALHGFTAASATIDGVALSSAQLTALQVDIDATNQYHTITGSILIVSFVDADAYPILQQSLIGSLLGDEKQFMGIFDVSGYHDTTYYRNIKYANVIGNLQDVFNYDTVDESLHFRINSTYINRLSLTVAYLDLSNNSAELSSLPSTVEKSYYYQAQNDASIEKYGKRPRKFFYPMLEDMTTTAAVCRRILGGNAEKQRKAQIIVPHLSNSIQIGSKVTITNTLKKIQNEELTVKSINYKFPNFKTTVNVGDYSYDFLDNMGQLMDTVNSNESVRSGVT
tara:strand:+ start:3023 stop:5482 length:2460 start_codon:yes stop_codon:yes gene_type:complete